MWAFGLSRYLNKISERGYLPKRFAETNNNCVPKNSFILQVIIVTVLSLFYLWMPHVEDVYWYLRSELPHSTVSTYSIAYIVFFFAAIKLIVKNIWDKQK